MADTPRTASVATRLGTASIGLVLIGVAAWLTLRNLSLGGGDGWMFWVPVTVWFLTMGVLCWWSTLSGRQTTRGAWRAGWMVGGIGLAIGFLGPLVLQPKANLGPLLGILVTGPFGFVVGVLGAGVMQAVRGLR
jgi:hypothetical protein